MSVNMIMMPGTACSKPVGISFRFPADWTSSVRARGIW